MAALAAVLHDSQTANASGCKGQKKKKAKNRQLFVKKFFFLFYYMAT
jgi:hypothetical protein